MLSRDSWHTEMIERRNKPTDKRYVSHGGRSMPTTSWLKSTAIVHSRIKRLGDGTVKVGHARISYTLLIKMYLITTSFRGSYFIWAGDYAIMRKQGCESPHMLHASAGLLIRVVEARFCRWGWLSFLSRYSYRFFIRAPNTVEVAKFERHYWYIEKPFTGSMLIDAFPRYWKDYAAIYQASDDEMTADEMALMAMSGWHCWRRIK